MKAQHIAQKKNCLRAQGLPLKKLLPYAQFRLPKFPTVSEALPAFALKALVRCYNAQPFAIAGDGHIRLIAIAFHRE